MKHKQTLIQLKLDSHCWNHVALKERLHITHLHVYLPTYLAERYQPLLPIELPRPLADAENLPHLA